MPDAEKGVEATLSLMEASIRTLTEEAGFAVEITFSAGVARYTDVRFQEAQEIVLRAARADCIRIPRGYPRRGRVKST